MEARDLLGDIGLVEKVGAERRNDYIVAVELAVDLLEDSLHLVERELRVEEVIHPIGIELDSERLAL